MLEKHLVGIDCLLLLVGVIATTMDLKISLADRLVIAKLSGAFSLQRGRECFLEMLAAMEKYANPVGLVDALNVTGEIQIVERFDIALFFAEEMRKFNLAHKELGILRIAFVMKPPILDPERFGETVAINRGANVKACETIEEAMPWLLGG